MANGIQGRKIGRGIGDIIRAIGDNVNRSRLLDAEEQEARQKTEQQLVASRVIGEYYTALNTKVGEWQTNKTTPTQARMDAQLIFERMARPFGLEQGAATESILSDYTKEFERGQEATTLLAKETGATAISKGLVDPRRTEAEILQDELLAEGARAIPGDVTPLSGVRQAGVEEEERRTLAEARLVGAEALPAAAALKEAEATVEPLRTQVEELAEAEEPAAPLTGLGKHRADFEAGRITEEEFNAFIAKEFPPTDGPLSEEDRFNRSAKLRAEVSKATTDFEKVAQSASRIQASAVDASPAGDLALVFNFMKILDPGSVVRESEFRTAADAKAWLVKMESSGITVPAFIADPIRKATEGTILTAQQRRDFVGRAGKLFEAQERVNEATIEGFVNLAKGFKLDRKDVIVQRGRPQPFGEFIKSLGPAPEVSQDPIVIELDAQFPAADNAGQRKVDDATGAIFESDGSTWRRVQ